MFEQISTVLTRKLYENVKNVSAIQEKGGRRRKANYI